jgi:dinuclear metal center YbgI/SA1388 family protein
MELKKLVDYLDDLLNVKDFVSADVSLNGLQVGDVDSDVRRVAFAVDACMESFKKAVDCGAQLLVVHHGLFWGRPVAVTGMHYQRISFLVEHGLALYACHLPLDAHPLLGNNVQMASALGLWDVEPFSSYHGKMIGCKGVLPKSLSVDQVCKMLNRTANAKLEFGRKLCRTVGIVSGSAATDVICAMDENLDLFITGEPSHLVYHDCEENGMNMLCLGHYDTETFGVKALLGDVGKMGLDTCFVDVPTGL